MVPNEALRNFAKNNILYIHRFIVFYTLRLLWRKYNNAVPELHKLLFEGGNIKQGRTKFERLLRDDTDLKPEDATRLGKLVGINQDFFTGRMKLSVPDLSTEVWVQLAYYYYSHDDSTPDEVKKLKEKVETAIVAAITNGVSEQADNFGRLAFFAKNRCKLTELMVTNRFSEIEKKIYDLKYSRELQTISIDRLCEHRDIVRQYLSRIDALCTLKEWEESITKK